MARPKKELVEKIKVEILVYRQRGKWVFEVEDHRMSSIKLGEAKRKPRSNKSDR